MAKRNSRVDQKKDNIQSRLLGTNVNEINIEKFRDPEEKKSKYNLHGKLNEKLLKTISNKFTTDVIFNLNLMNQELTNIQALELCTHLVNLNLKGNNISDLQPISNCVDIVYLDIMDNNITSLEPLKKCEKLVSLHAEGNKITSTKSLQGLDNCKNLRTLYLKTLSGEYQNPICEAFNYRDTIFQVVPALQRLDGIPKKVQLDNGEGLIKEQKPLDLQLSNQPWFSSNMEKFSEKNQSSKINGEEQLKSDLKDCKSKISQLEAKLRAVMVDLK